MRPEDVTLILEGTHGQTQDLEYCPLELVLPDNARVIRIGRQRLFYHGNFNPALGASSIVAQPIRNSESKGIELQDSRYPQRDAAVDWIFAMPRFLATRKGKIFANECTYTRSFAPYQATIPIVVEDCSRFFRGDISLEELANLNHRAF